MPKIKQGNVEKSRQRRSRHSHARSVRFVRERERREERQVCEPEGRQKGDHVCAKPENAAGGFFQHSHYERQLVRQERGCTVYRHDAVVLESLRAMWASYRAHFTMANTFRLWQALVKGFRWVREFFEVEDGLLVRRGKMPVGFPNVRTQYRFFADRVPDALVLFQVGCFFECYEGQATNAIRLLKLRQLKAGCGFRVRCGFPVWWLPRYRDRLLTGGNRLP